MIEISFYGRGGEGVVSAAKMLSQAAFLSCAQGEIHPDPPLRKEGEKQLVCQSLPEFGPERRGAPVRAFTRLDYGSNILDLGPIATPNHLVVFNSSLVDSLVIQDLENNTKAGYVIINSFDLSPNFNRFAKNFYFLPANQIKQNFQLANINSLMLAGLLKVLPLASKEILKNVLFRNRFDCSANVLEAIDKIFGSKIITIQENIFVFEV